MCDDYPVARVTKGSWGDEYPALRIVGETSLNQKVEAYNELIEYGAVPEAEALANRAFIREAPTDIAALIAEVEQLRAQTSTDGLREDARQNARAKDLRQF